MENRKSAFSCLSRGPVSCRLVSLPPGACVCVVGTIVDGREVSRFVADQSGCPGTSQDSGALRRLERPHTKYDSNAMQSSVV